MSVNNKFISNKEAIPVIETDVFSIQPDRRFALTVLGKGNIPAQGNEDIFNAYLRLRANVYIDQTGMLEPELRQEDQTESDKDDARSLHIAVLENQSSYAETTRNNLSRVAVVGAMRVIEKEQGNDDRLPIEDFFEKELNGFVTEVGSNEISRYIVRHENPRHKKVVRDLMHATALAYIVQNNLGPTLAVVEPELEQTLQKQGVPFTRIADPKLVPKYNDLNLGIQIHTDLYADQFGRDIINGMNTSPLNYAFWGDLEHEDQINGSVAS